MGEKLKLYGFNNRGNSGTTSPISMNSTIPND